MSLSPLFDQLLKMGLLFRLVKGAGAVESARLVKVCKRRETLLIDKYDPANRVCLRRCKTILNRILNTPNMS